MAKYSISHPECGIEFFNWYLNVRKDRKRPIPSFSNYELEINSVLEKIFPAAEIPP